MAGLSVLLEAQKTFPKCPQIISKTTLRRRKSAPSPVQTSPFLEHCFLCQERLLEGKDIYMYRGDRAFCSVECRCRQIFMDEESVKRDNCSLAAASEVSATASPAVRRRGTAAEKSRALAGSFAY